MNQKQFLRKTLSSGGTRLPLWTWWKSHLDPESIPFIYRLCMERNCECLLGSAVFDWNRWWDSVEIVLVSYHCLKIVDVTTNLRRSMGPHWIRSVNIMYIFYLLHWSLTPVHTTNVFLIWWFIHRFNVKLNGFCFFSQFFSIVSRFHSLHARAHALAFTACAYVSTSKRVSVAFHLYLYCS